MTCHFTWIDSPLPIDALGRALWRLLSRTADDDAILGIDNDAASAAHNAYLRNLKHALANGSQLLIGSVDGRLVLSCLLYRHTLPTTSHLAELQKGTIAPEYRGQGHLARAFGHIARRSRQLGIARLTLDVREDSPAHRLWQHWGFQSFGVLEDYARYQGQSFRGHFMQQSVDALAARVASLGAAETLQE